MSSSTETGTSISGTGTVSSNGFSTLGTYLTDWRGQFGAKSGNRDALIVRHINIGVADIARQMPDDKLTYSFSISVVSGTAAYALDVSTQRFKRMTEGSVKLTDGSSNVSIPQPLPYHAIEGFKASDNGASGACAYYAIQPHRVQDLTQIELYDTPAASYTLTGQYIYRPGRLSVGQDGTAIPLPEECQDALDAWMDYCSAKDVGRAVTEVQDRLNFYRMIREEFAHDERKSNIARFGDHEPQHSRYLNNTNDYTDL